MSEPIASQTVVEEMVPFALRLPKKLHRNLKIIASLSGASANSLVIELIQAHIDRNAKALGKAKEAAKMIG